MTKMNPYLKMLKENNYNPNFWCSENYFYYAEWVTEVNNGWVIVRDKEGQLMLPVINDEGITLVGNWWAGLDDKMFLMYGLLDYNFIYDPRNFLNLEGSCWKVFRKNIKKFPRNRKGLRYEYCQSSDLSTDVFISWLCGRKEDEIILDDDVILKYLHHTEKKILYDDNEVYGINIWDENYKYVNYRYCFTDGSPFLSEYMRYLFYTDKDILQKEKLINDGGSLGSEGLHNFKVRLNPVEIIEIKTKYFVKN